MIIREFSFFFASQTHGHNHGFGADVPEVQHVHAGAEDCEGREREDDWESRKVFFFVLVAEPAVWHVWVWKHHPTVATKARARIY